MRQNHYHARLGGICSTRDGHILYVTAPEAERAYKIDANSLEVQDEYETGSGPDGIAISHDDSKIYVTNTQDGTISIINVLDKRKKTIEAGGKPELIHSNHDHSRLYISNFLENKVHILDTRVDEIIYNITGLDGPEEAVLSKSGDRLFVVNFNISRVYIFEARTYQKLSSEFVVGKKPIGLVFAEGASKLYVSNYGDNTVSVLILADSEK